MKEFTHAYNTEDEGEARALLEERYALMQTTRDLNNRLWTIDQRLREIGPFDG